MKEKVIGLAPWPKLICEALTWQLACVCVCVCAVYSHGFQEQSELTLERWYFQLLIDAPCPEQLWQLHPLGLYKTAQFLLKCYKMLSNLWPPRHDKSRFHLKRIRHVPEEYKTECTEKWGWALPKLFLVFSLLADWLAILVEVGEEKQPQSRGISQAGLTQHAKQVSQSADRCSCTPKTGWQVFAVRHFWVFAVWVHETFSNKKCVSGQTPWFQ